MELIIILVVFAIFEKDFRILLKEFEDKLELVHRKVIIEKLICY